MEYKHLIVEQADGYMVVAINYPPANAISQAVLGDLDAFFEECLTDDAIRAIVITGSGHKLFSAGADITELECYQPGNHPKYHGHDLFTKIERYPKPVIAAMQGSAFGGGLELAISCHLRILSATAKLGLPEVSLGIIPGFGGTQRLPRLIGKTKALEMGLLGDPITAEEALRLGLVNRVVAPEAVLPEARSLAARLAKGAPIAQREILKATMDGLEVSLDEGLKIERHASNACFVSEDSKEGVRAFSEKRAPNFQGK